MGCGFAFELGSTKAVRICLVCARRLSVRLRDAIVAAATAAPNLVNRFFRALRTPDADPFVGPFPTQQHGVHERLGRAW